MAAQEAGHDNDRVEWDVQGECTRQRVAQGEGVRVIDWYEAMDVPREAAVATDDIHIGIRKQVARMLEEHQVGEYR